MSQPDQSSSFQERVTQVRNRLVERLQTFRPGPRVYATAFCIGATIGEYAALAGSTDPAAVLAAISALSAQLGINLLADVIGDREPPPGLTADEIAEAVQERLEQGEDLPAVRTLLQEFGTLQLALETWRQAEDECWQQLVNELSRHPQLIATQVTQDVVTALDPRLATLEERTQHVLGMLENVVAVQQAIKHHLGLDRSQATIVAEIKAALDAAPRGMMFESGGLCGGYLLQPMPDRYFVAQEFSPGRADLRNALAGALSEFGVQPVVADDFYWSGPILCKISALIQGTPFGVYQLTVSQNRNVHLELGIALGLGRPFVLVKDKGAEVAGLLEGLEYYEINSYLETRYELGNLLRPFVTNIGNYRAQALPEAGSTKTAVIAHGNLEAIDFCVAVSKMLNAYGLIPIILADPTGKIAEFLNREKIPHQVVGSAERIALDDTIAAIQAARLGVYRIDKTADPSTFLALGVSMGLNRPGILVRKSGCEPPSDLGGLSPLVYTSYTELEKSFPRKYAHLLTRYS